MLFIHLLFYIFILIACFLHFYYSIRPPLYCSLNRRGREQSKAFIASEWQPKGLHIFFFIVYPDMKQPL